MTKPANEDWIQYCKQRREWLNWYSKKLMLYDLFAQEEKKSQYKPLRKYDWKRRANARLWGFFIPLLVGDIEAGPFINVIDDFGDLLGTASAYPTEINRNEH